MPKELTTQSGCMRNFLDIILSTKIPPIEIFQKKSQSVKYALKIAQKYYDDRLSDLDIGGHLSMYLNVSLSLLLIK